MTKLYKADYDCFRDALKKIEIIAESIPQLTFQLYSLFILNKNIIQLITTNMSLFQSIFTSILSLAFNINTLIKNDYPLPKSDGRLITFLFYFLKIYFIALIITSGIIFNAEFLVINMKFALFFFFFKFILFLGINFYEFYELKKSKEFKIKIFKNNWMINIMTFILYLGYLNIGIYKNVLSVSNKWNYVRLKIFYLIYYLIFSIQTFSFLIIHVFFYNNSFEWFLLYFFICYNVLFIFYLYLWVVNNLRQIIINISVS